MYVNYVGKKYGKPLIVFGGYDDGPSTKDATYQRRSGGVTSPTAHFTEDIVIQTKKEEFLSNKHNKQLLINTLSSTVTNRGCRTLHASGDADFMIVQTALQSAKTCNTSYR